LFDLWCLDNYARTQNILVTAGRRQRTCSHSLSLSKTRRKQAPETALPKQAEAHALIDGNSVICAGQPAVPMPGDGRERGRDRGRKASDGETSECRHIGDVVSERRMERLEGDGSRRSATILRSLNLALAITCVQCMAMHALVRSCTFASRAGNCCVAVGGTAGTASPCPVSGTRRYRSRPGVRRRSSRAPHPRGLASAGPPSLYRKHGERFARWGARRWQP